MPTIDHLLADVRYALRSMRGSPGFTVTATLTLLLGMGSTTAIFSVIYAVLWRPLPYRDPQRLVQIAAAEPGDRTSGLPLLAYDAVRERSGSLEQVAVYYRNTGWSRVITGGRTDPEQVQAGFVSSDFFAVLGVAPAAGRVFGEAEVRSAERVAVLSHSFWLKRFGGSHDALGQMIAVNDMPHTVIGVMPPAFAFPAADTKLWAPISTHAAWLERPAADLVHSRGFFLRWNLVARLRAGATAEMAHQELQDLDRRLAERDKDWNLGLPMQALPVGVEVGERARLSLWLLFGAVGLVLLIACANVANLLLARGASRTKEMAIRMALGASRGRIAQQILMECLVLVFVATGLALAVANWTIRWLVALGPADFPRLAEARVDGPVLLFALAAAGLTAVLFGLVPALRATRIRGPREERSSGALIVAEFAIAIVLTTAAGLLLQSLWRAETVELGYAPERVLALRMQFPAAVGTGQRYTVLEQMRERLHGLPGVERVGGIRSLFELGTPPGNSLRQVEGEPEEAQKNRPLTWTTVSGEYFQAMGVRLLRGRLFGDPDREGKGLVAVVDQSMATRYWAGRDPIGKRFKGRDRRGIHDDWITVIGVVQDARRQGLEQEPTPHVYLWHRQSEPVGDWVIRSSVRPETLIASVRQVVRDVEPRMVINSLAPMEQLLDSQVAARRFQTWLLTSFAILALTLAAVGIYGVMSHSAARRTHEIGIRMALGADRAGVVRLILKRGFGLASLGLAIGVVLAAGTTRIFSSLLFGISPADPPSFVLALLLLLGVAGVATWIPAWRASGLNPLQALRKE